LTTTHEPTIEAPEIDAESWVNTPLPLSLAGLRGRVVMLHAFQMLCPGCVLHGTPQAEKIHREFADRGLQVIGLHSVFEHHAVMNRAALEVYVHEFRLTFPIAVDRPGAAGHHIPRTMQAYGLRGTPSVVVIDRAGRVRLNHFGQVSDLELGAHMGSLLKES
jgi:peroxiredoxin